MSASTRLGLHHPVVLGNARTRRGVLCKGLPKAERSEALAECRAVGYPSGQVVGVGLSDHHGPRHHDKISTFATISEDCPSGEDTHLNPRLTEALSAEVGRGTGDRGAAPEQHLTKRSPASDELTGLQATREESGHESA